MYTKGSPKEYMKNSAGVLLSMFAANHLLKIISQKEEFSWSMES